MVRGPGRPGCALRCIAPAVPPPQTHAPGRPDHRLGMGAMLPALLLHARPPPAPPLPPRPVQQPMLEWLASNYKMFGCLLEFVTDRSEEGNQFCKGFGGIGGVLRYSVRGPCAAQGGRAGRDAAGRPAAARGDTRPGPAHAPAAALALLSSLERKFNLAPAHAPPPHTPPPHTGGPHRV